MPVGKLNGSFTKPGLAGAMGIGPGSAGAPKAVHRVLAASTTLDAAVRQTAVRICFFGVSTLARHRFMCRSLSRAQGFRLYAVVRAVNNWLAALPGPSALPSEWLPYRVRSCSNSPH